MVKQIVVYSYHRILINNKENKNIDKHINMHKSPEDNAEWGRKQFLEVIYNMILFI